MTTAQSKLRHPVQPPVMNPSAARPPEGASAPPGGSATGAAVERGDQYPLGGQHPLQRPSLRTLLMWQVVGPLLLIWAIGGAVTLWLASRHVQQAYDRALLDDALAIAAQVVRTPGELRLDLSDAELKVLLYDQSEQVYFSLQTLDGHLVAGHAGLLAEAPEENATHRFGTAQLRGRELRTVTLRREGDPPFLIVMAQTTEARGQLLRHLVIYSVLVQLILMALLIAWLRRAVTRQMLPLQRLHWAVQRRDADDLRALPPVLSDAATTRDIQRLGQSVNALFDRLARSLAAQREFTGNVAHELRTPLAGIGARAEYALAQSDPAVWREQLEGIVRSQALASHTVTQLLALARADEAQSTLQLRPVAIGPLARTVALQFLQRADAQGVDLGAQGLDTPARVLGDAVLLEGLLGNLLDNALRHGSQAAAPRVTLVLRESPQGVELAVIDNGRGIDEAQCGHLQQRGVQGHVDTAQGGAGLGFAIVHRYAELMHAHFGLRNAPEGEGLEAWLRFPPAP